MGAEGTCTNRFCVGDCAMCPHWRDLENAYEKGFREANEWIPVSAATMPPIRKDVLLCLKNGSISTGSYKSFLSDEYFYVHSEPEKYVEIENVLAWQLLPEVYKKEELNKG